MKRSCIGDENKLHRNYKGYKKGLQWICERVTKELQRKWKGGKNNLQLRHEIDTKLLHRCI